MNVVKSNIHKLLTICLLFPSIIGCSQKSRNEEIHFKNNKFPTSDLSYLLYKPKDFSADRALPLLLFLHGSGSGGDTFSKVKATGIPRLIEEGQDFPFLIISPKLPDSFNNRWPPEFIDEFISHALLSYRIDPNRIYLTGFSMGGSGVWDYACAYPDRISCAVPLSGWGNTQEVCKMKSVPTWAFHGINDIIVSPVGSRNSTNALKKCGGNVTLTELPDVGHDSWRKAYSYPGLINWISSKNKSDTIRKKRTIRLDNKTTAYKLPKALYQITGIVTSSLGDFYGIAGKNSRPVLFNFDTLGHIKKTIWIKNASNLSWQDLARGDNGFIYIADVGNEGFKRKFFQIYKIKEDDINDKDKQDIEAQKIEFTLTSENSLNFKAIFFMNNFLYLFGETSSNELKLIQVNDQPGAIVPAEMIGSYAHLNSTSITSSFFDNKTKSIFLLNKNEIISIDLSMGIESLKSGKTSILNLGTESYKEGVTRLTNGDLVFVDQNFLELLTATSTASITNR